MFPTVLECQLFRCEEDCTTNAFSHNLPCKTEIKTHKFKYRVPWYLQDLCTVTVYLAVIISCWVSASKRCLKLKTVIEYSNHPDIKALESDVDRPPFSTFRSYCLNSNRRYLYTPTVRCRGRVAWVLLCLSAVEYAYMLIGIILPQVINHPITPLLLKPFRLGPPFDNSCRLLGWEFHSWTNSGSMCLFTDQGMKDVPSSSQAAITHCPSNGCHTHVQADEINYQ